MRFKALLAVVALAIGFTGTATAQVQDGSAGEGTLFLTVFDPNRSETYNVSLGTTISAYLANPTGFAADAGLSAWLAGASDLGAILFDVAVINFNPPQQPAGLFGALVTAGGLPNTPDSFSSVNSLLINMQSYVQGVNASIANTGSIATGGSGYFQDGFTWNRNIGGQLGGAITGGSIGAAIGLYSILSDGSDASANTWVVSQVTSLTLNADGSLSVIPIPAAGWLLLSALAGLVGIARRRKAVAAAA